MTQRNVHKIIERLLRQKFEHRSKLLKAVVRELIEHTAVILRGADIWQLDDTSECYSLIYQHGQCEVLSKNVRGINENPTFVRLNTVDTVVIEADDISTKDNEQSMYAVAGVGSKKKIGEGLYYQYIIGFHAPKFRTKFVDTVGIISSSVTLHLKQIESKRSEKEIAKELQKASEIQQGLLPENHITFKGYDIYGLSIPAQVVGGDYFDYVEPAAGYEERLGVVVSDAASKGLSAAVQALFVSGAIRMATGFHTKISSLVARLNQLIHSTFPYERFVTMFYCELLSSENGLVLYANAGHFPPIHYSKEYQSFTDLNPTGGILGVIPDQHFSVENINMQIGDVLVIPTDGISEAQNAASEFIHDSHIKDILRKYAHLSAQEIAEGLLHEIDEFAQDSTYQDDKTLVVIKRVGFMNQDD